MSYRPKTISEKLELEARGLVRVFMPHDENSHFRKVVTVAFMAAWLFITVGIAVENLDVIQPPHYGIFTALVFLIIGKQWDIEVERLKPTITIKHEGDDED